MIRNNMEPEDQGATDGELVMAWKMGSLPEIADHQRKSGKR